MEIPESVYFEILKVHNDRVGHVAKVTVAKRLNDASVTIPNKTKNIEKFIEQCKYCVLQRRYLSIGAILSQFTPFDICGAVQGLVDRDDYSIDRLCEPLMDEDLWPSFYRDYKIKSLIEQKGWLPVQEDVAKGTVTEENSPPLVEKANEKAKPKQTPAAPHPPPPLKKKEEIVTVPESLHMKGKVTSSPPPAQVSAKAKKVVEPVAVMVVEETVPVAVGEKKKLPIPKHIKTLVWGKYIGNETPLSKCMSCKHETIDIRNFHCGHVLAEANGGSMLLDNLRPICAPCNGSMGTMGMNEFTTRFFGWTV